MVEVLHLRKNVSHYKHCECLPEINEEEILNFSLVSWTTWASTSDNTGESSGEATVHLTEVLKESVRKRVASCIRTAEVFQEVIVDGKIERLYNGVASHVGR